MIEYWAYVVDMRVGSVGYAFNETHISNQFDSFRACYESYIEFINKVEEVYPQIHSIQNEKLVYCDMNQTYHTCTLKKWSIDFGISKEDFDDIEQSINEKARLAMYKKIVNKCLEIFDNKPAIKQVMKTVLAPNGVYMQAGFDMHEFCVILCRHSSFYCLAKWMLNYHRHSMTVETCGFVMKALDKNARVI